ncbi:hypothetical protein QA612_17555 [Evansella sp. AB-P1]|uniref:CBO0543 family protein n=1 Tax=Evansella sp. AB-P1 TaxID=3037653 RepID=UPI00241C209F|nr:CBO0543 family protein [Evansella sp. AB-P1]MDG5789269.1 hypothetical protein [Evansella sp. AB-P1]
MLERFVIRFAIVFGILAIPTLFRKPSWKLWVPYFLLNGVLNHLFDAILVKTGKLKYPVRFLPRKFKINFVYDYIICAFLSVWYGQATYNSRLPGIVGKLLLFGLPQSTYEIWGERKTKLLKFQGNWDWVHSAFAVFIVKILTRSILEVIKRVVLPKIDENVAGDERG